jgi:hypothetical protein
VFFDDSTDNDDHGWLGGSWDYSGDSISFGYGDTLWLSGFPVSYGFLPSTVAIVGFQPQ